MVQNRFVPLSISDQIIFFFGVINNFLLGVSATKVTFFEYTLNDFLFTSVFHLPLRHELEEESRLDRKMLNFVYNRFNAQFKIFFH